MAPMSLGVMPRSIRGATWRYAAMVMSAAFCMSASSAGDLTMRQARTTAAPLMICTSGITRISPSIAK